MKLTATLCFIFLVQLFFYLPYPSIHLWRKTLNTPLVPDKEERIAYLKYMFCTSLGVNAMYALIESWKRYGSLEKNDKATEPVQLKVQASGLYWFTKEKEIEIV
jgi:hypothetical protein